MPVDFFNEKCRTTSNKARFGLCDDPPPRHTPAYIDEDNEDEWIGIVTNRRLLDINFYAVDHCVDLPFQESKEPQRCDGIILAESTLVFVELKARDERRNKWIKKGINQLIPTIEFFKQNYEITGYNRVEARICNKKRPISHSGRSEKMQNFKDITGMVLYTDQEIQI